MYFVGNGGHDKMSSFRWFYRHLSTNEVAVKFCDFTPLNRRYPLPIHSLLRAGNTPQPWGGETLVWIIIIRVN